MYIFFLSPGIYFGWLTALVGIPLLDSVAGGDRERRMTKTCNMASKKLKRTWNGRKDYEYDHDSDSDCEVMNQTPDPWARFILVKPADESKPLSSLSPFDVSKAFEGICNGLSNVKRLKDGSFLVKCNSKKQSELLLKRDGSVFIDRPIKVEIHRHLNSCKGVIRCRDLNQLSEGEIKKEMSSQSVIDVRRCSVKKDGKTITTNTYFLTFCLPHIPETVRIGYLKVKASLYVPAPMRCYTCQKFGHTSSKCTATDQTCVRCGKHRHESACDLKCTNCEGEHAANSKECPCWKLESAIQRVHAEQKVSFGEAKKSVQASGYSGSVNTNSKSFAKVVSSGQSSSLQDAIQKLTTTVEQLNQRVANLENRLAFSNSVTGPSCDRSSATKLVSPFSFSAAGPLNKEDPVFIPPFKLTFLSCSQSKTDSKNVSTT